MIPIRRTVQPLNDLFQFNMELKLGTVIEEKTQTFYIHEQLTHTKLQSFTGVLHL